MALHSRDAVTVSAAVATRSRADCFSMEGHTSPSYYELLRNYFEIVKIGYRERRGNKTRLADPAYH